MQNSHLLTQHPPDDKQRFHQGCQVRHVLNELLNARFELCPTNYANLETEVA